MVEQQLAVKNKENQAAGSDMEETGEPSRCCGKAIPVFFLGETGVGSGRAEELGMCTF